MRPPNHRRHQAPQSTFVPLLQTVRSASPRKEERRERSCAPSAVSTPKRKPRSERQPTSGRYPHGPSRIKLCAHSFLARTADASAPFERRRRDLVDAGDPEFRQGASRSASVDRGPDAEPDHGLPGPGAAPRVAPEASYRPGGPPHPRGLHGRGQRGAGRDLPAGREPLPDLHRRDRLHQSVCLRAPGLPGGAGERGVDRPITSSLAPGAAPTGSSRRASSVRSRRRVSLVRRRLR